MLLRQVDVDVGPVARLAGGGLATWALADHERALLRGRTARPARAGRARPAMPGPSRIRGSHVVLVRSRSADAWGQRSASAPARILVEAGQMASSARRSRPVCWNERQATPPASSPAPSLREERVRIVVSSRRSVAQILPGAACQSRGLLAKRRSPVHTDNPRFGGKAPVRIEAVDVIDRPLHVGRILAFAQWRRDARHHGRRNAADMTRRSAVNMAAENSDDPPGVLQGLAQRSHHLRRFEMDGGPGPPATSNGGWCAKTAIGLVVSASIMSIRRCDPLGTKVALVAVCAQGIERDQPDRIILNRIVDKVGIGREISVGRKGRAQIRPVVLVAGQDIDRRMRLREDGRTPWRIRPAARYERYPRCERSRPAPDRAR